MAITDSIKDVLTIKLKPRHDNYSDQFSRIFLVKVMMIGALLVGLNWYNDKITCVIPGALGIDGGFVSSACWINGFYIYEEIRELSNAVGYYGVPRNMKYDGRYTDSDGDLCVVSSESPDCKPMEKTFFLQYQYMTFVLAALGILYYAPYAVFRLLNQDMASLKGSIKENEAEPIVKNYFNYRINTPMKMRLRIVGNLLVKCLYIAANVGAFFLVSSVLNGRFITFGSEWANWSKLNNTMAYDYMGRRETPKPGNILLPSFGICEVREAAKDEITSVHNTHQFVCELSQHILYQYVFIILWYAMIFGMIVSCLGLVLRLVDHIVTIACFLKGGAPARRMYQQLTLRECEYLEYIRLKNMPLYGNIIQLLKQSRLGEQGEEALLKDDDDLQMDNVKGTLA